MDDLYIKLADEVTKVNKFIYKYSIENLNDIEESFKLIANMFKDGAINSEAFAKEIELANRVKTYFKQRKFSRYKPGDKVKIKNSQSVENIIEGLANALELEITKEDINKFLKRKFIIEKVEYILSEPYYVLKNKLFKMGEVNILKVHESFIEFNNNVREARVNEIIPGPAI
jgi:hypothetical protein